MFILILTCLFSFALAQTTGTTPEKGVSAEVQDLLKNRFVSTIRESVVDSKLEDIPEFRKCAEGNEITKDTLADAASKQIAARDCFELEMKKIQKGDKTKLDELQKKLKLEAMGLVKGSDTKTMVDYLSKRLTKALYKFDPSAKPPTKFEGQQIVDQKVFIDLYKTQVGKVIIMEMAKYCYEDLRWADPNSTTPTAPTTYVQKILLVQDPVVPPATSGNVANFTDEPPATTATTATTKDLKTILTEINNNIDGMDAKLNGGFTACAQVMRELCESYQLPTAQLPPPSPKGRKSCQVQANLRSYQRNLDILKQMEAQWNEMQAPGTGFRATEVAYFSGSKDDTSIDALTTMTSKDVVELYKGAKTDIDKECETKPEDPKCNKYFFNEKEQAKLESSKQAYDAATAIEIRKIELTREREKLEEYLKTKGYLDILEEIKQKSTTSSPMNEDDIQKAIINKLRKEREASYQELANSFKKKQLTSDTSANKKIASILQAELKEKESKLTELVIFNNLISGYLSAEELGSKKQTTYVNQARREMDAIKKDIPDDKYFQQIAENIKKESSGSTDASSIDALDFVNVLIGKKPEPKIK